MKRGLTLGLGLALALCCGTAMAVDFYGSSYNTAPNQTIFVSGFQRFARLKSNSGERTTARYNPTAGAIGYLYQQDNWKAGAAFSWEDGTRKYDLSGLGSAKVKSNTPGISVFGAMNLADDYYVDASGFLGFRSMRMRDIRLGGVDLGRSNHLNKTVFALSLEGGRNFLLGNDMILTPHVGVDYAYTPTEDYRIVGETARISSQSYWEIPVGVSLKRTFACGNWAVTPKFDATLVNSLGGMSGAKNVQPGFAYRAADSWKVAGIGGSHFGARLSAGVDAKLGERTSVGVDYTYEGRKQYNDHRISAMFGLSF